MTTVDITEWHPQKVEGFLAAIKSDHPGIEISITLRSDGEQQMSMALSDEPASDFTAHRCQVCDAITVAKVLPLDRVKGRNALTAAGDSEPAHDKNHRSNGTEPTNAHYTGKG